GCEPPVRRRCDRGARRRRLHRLRTRLRPRREIAARICGVGGRSAKVGGLPGALAVSDYGLAEICVVACAEAFRGDGEILASPIASTPTLGVKLARATFAPDLLMTDGGAQLVDRDGVVEGWMPYRRIFDVVWSGRRHVMMGATQLDRRGNQNISCIGPHEK